MNKKSADKLELLRAVGRTFASISILQKIQ